MENAYIFDFDGVLANTMETHYILYKKVLEGIGVNVNKKDFYFQAGKTGREMIKFFLEKSNLEVNETLVEKLYREKSEMYVDYIYTTTKVDCNLKLLDMLKANGIPVAIASGSSRPSILPIMEMFKISVDTLVTSEDVENGKPDPELFIRAAEKLGVNPKNCIVIEDSETGIKAARAAGMKAFHFYDNEVK